MTRFAITRQRVTIAAVVFIMAAGLQSYFSVSRDEDPGFTIRQALVLTYWPGASPERVENLITDPLEKAIQEIPELDYLKSESKTGLSVLYVNIKVQYFDLQPIWDLLRRKTDRAARTLPEGVIGPFVNDEFGDVFGIVLGLRGEGFDYRELKDVADDVRDRLLFLPDAAKVEIHGAQEERIFVEYNNARLAELGLSPLLLRSMLEAQNIVIPGGEIRLDAERITLEPTGNFESVDDLKRTVLSTPMTGELFFLEDVAHIFRGYVDPPSSVVHSNGETALALAVSMRKGGNILELGAQVKACILELNEHYPIGIDFDIIQFQPEAVDSKVQSFVVNLLEAMGLVALVMLIFLGLRTGLVVATLVPMVVLLTFTFIELLDIGINQVSLAALIIALGMLVDNGIVISESILVQMQGGKDVKEAAIDSARELRWPLLTASLATSSAFLPFYLAESEAGEYTGSLFTVVSITLLSSWCLALTVIPVLCVLFLKPKKRDFALYESRFYRLYRRILITLLRHRAPMLAVIILLFVAAVYGFSYVPKMFFPPNERPSFLVELYLPTGTAIEETLQVTQQVEDLLDRKYRAAHFRGGESGTEGVVSWGAFIGAGAPRFLLTYTPSPPTPEYAILVVNASTRAVIDEIVPLLEEEIAEQSPNVKPRVRPLELGPPVGYAIQIRISGQDPDRLFQIVDSVKLLLQETPGTKNIDDDWGSRTKKLLVHIDQPRARRAGVTSQDIALSLQTHLSGFGTTEYREGDTLIPVVLRAEGADREDIGKLESINVYVQRTGQSVPLKQVADIELVWQPAKILRRDRMKTVTVQADLAEGLTPSETLKALTPALEELRSGWELGYGYAFGGEVEESAESQQSIVEKLPLSGLVIVLLLVLMFDSYRRPIIILITIPLAMIGVSVGLLVVPNMYFGFMTLLGIVSLSGIVINNAVVLLDRIRIEEEELGRERRDAIVHAAQQRLRPIFLTTATTVMGLVPLYLGGGPMFQPMAVTIMFGLLFATLLTLGVVPVLYSIFFRASFKGYIYAGANTQSKG
jgi:multidrug efflux pump subunit AcrB